MNRSTFCEIKYLNGLFFSKTRYMIWVGFTVLARTPVQNYPRVTPTPPRVPDLCITLIITVITKDSKHVCISRRLISYLYSPA